MVAALMKNLCELSRELKLKKTKQKETVLTLRIKGSKTYICWQIAAPWQGKENYSEPSPLNFEFKQTSNQMAC